MNGWERLAWNHGARRHPRGYLDVIWDTGPLVQKKRLWGFLLMSTKQHCLPRGMLIEFVVFCQEARRWGLESFGSSLSLFYCGAHVVRLGTHTSRSKRTWDLEKQPEHYRTKCNSPDSKCIQKPALSALRKDDHVLEVMSTFPDVLSLPELCLRDLIDEYKLMVLLLHICHVFCWVTLVFATDSHIYSQK